MHGRKKIVHTALDADREQDEARRKLETLRILHYRDVFNRIRDKV
jgi:hypothetical protein